MKTHTLLVFRAGSYTMGLWAHLVDSIASAGWHQPHILDFFYDRQHSDVHQDQRALTVMGGAEPVVIRVDGPLESVDINKKHLMPIADQARAILPPVIAGCARVDDEAVLILDASRLQARKGVLVDG